VFGVAEEKDFNKRLKPRMFKLLDAAQNFSFKTEAFIS
jgi:hypothetical protein